MEINFHTQEWLRVIKGNMDIEEKKSVFLTVRSVGQKLGLFKAIKLKEQKTDVGISRLTVIPKHAPDTRKILMDDNHCTHQRIKKELNIGSAALRKSYHEELHMEK
ncbi:hypothetical protein TNCV_5017131 [Trichonephila clavipes]|nr:hypothetical protein TNCV_5017131 [Trichonephila clavipes]